VSENMTDNHYWSPLVENLLHSKKEYWSVVEFGIKEQMEN